MKSFNTFGPCFPDRHYMLPPSERLPRIRGLVENGNYIVLHAPRQTGKTTALNTLAHSLMDEGTYVALAFSCEPGEALEGHPAAVERVVLGAISEAARQEGLPAKLSPPDPWPDAPDSLQILYGLGAWAQRCPKPLVLFFDEIDALVGDGLRSVLRQLRSGYNSSARMARGGSRLEPFPYSVAVCGLRNVRDYKEAAGGDAEHFSSASPFNIAEVLRMGDFNAQDVARLYEQHTAETGQPFTDEAVARAFEYTQGQPWLVNALAREVIDRMGVEPPTAVTAEHLAEAKERLILARANHLDSLVARLSEPRVRRVIEPLIAGRYQPRELTYSEDASYVRDLGLVAQDRPTRVANPIYREVIVRVLGAPIEDQIDIDPRRFVTDDGRLDFDLFLHEFTEFWCENGDVLSWGDYYHEVAPQLVLMAYLQRVVNGGGQVAREYGAGRRRIDLCVRWPYLDAAGKRQVQREAIELKVWSGGTDPLTKGLTQLDAYLDRLSLDQGTLVVFDRRDPDASIADLVSFASDKTPSGRGVTVVRA